MSQAKQTETRLPPAPEIRRKRRRRLALLGLAALFLVVGGSYGAYWALVGRFEQSTDDAYVAGNRVAVMPQEEGTVVAILADDTSRVHRGEILVRLDDSNARIALQQAKANLAATVRATNALYATEKQLQAKVAKQQATLELARHDYARDEDMHKLGYYSTKNLQHSETLVDVDKRSLAAAEQQLEAVRARVRDGGVADNPEVRLAAAKLRAAWLAVQRARIVAPVSGYVAERDVQLGEDVAPGTALMAIVPLDQLWVEANFKESQLASVRPGQTVTMQADLYGGSTTFHGRVIGIGAGTGSAFSLLPPQNATGNWIKVVQRVPVRIGIAKADLARHALRIGLSVNVTVETARNDRTKVGPIVAPHTYKTSVYEAQASGADRLIANIIRDNLGVAVGGDVARARARPEAGSSHGQ
ncbi:MAG TPA: efflux RND transporter periplasmic adaptor subunit [Gammaproteobacteria bacterium]|nr:efflux RND transporter periplasmic adaptor subunit [Gammaproteobacteria bacterium]